LLSDSDSANCTVLCAVVLTQYQRVPNSKTDGIAMASTALAMRALRLAITNVSSVQYTVIQTRCVLGSGNYWVPMCPIGFPGNCSERDWNRNANSCDWHESSIFTFAIFVELLLLLLLLISFSHELLFYVIRQMETFPHPTFSKRVFQRH